MLTFKQYLMEFYLNEAILNAKYSSKDGQRHIEKYIKPYLPGGDLHGSDTHTLEKDHGDLKKGTKLTLTGFYHDEKTGKTHVTARHAGSKKSVSIPMSSIRKPSQKDGKHNEEHAVKHMWNHFSSKGEDVPSVEDMHAEIEKAKTDRNHPLHIRHREDHEFSGKISGNNARVGTKESRQQAKQTYYQNLRDAAYTVHALANHKDFRSHWKNKDKIEHAGKAKPELSDHYKSKGVRGTGATSKGDALIIRSSKGGGKGVKALSFKKTGGSQLMSSSPAEFHAIYHHALKANPKNLKKLEIARRHMEKGEHEKANKIVQDLHDRHPHLIHHVTREALTGNGKFANAEGRATHVASIGKDAEVWTTDDFMHDHKDEISKLRPRVRGSKHGGTKSTVSLETPKKKKTDKNRK